MTLSDDKDESLAQFLESEFLSEVSDQEETCPEVSKAKRLCVEVDKLCSSSSTGLFRNVFKFLSSEDRIACSMVCRFMNIAVSDECLWRREKRIVWGESESSDNIKGELLYSLPFWLKGSVFNQKMSEYNNSLKKHTLELELLSTVLTKVYCRNHLKMSFNVMCS